MYIAEIPPAERITSATHANNANKVTHTTTEQIEISKYTTILPGPFKLDVSSIPARAVVTYLH